MGMASALFPSPQWHCWMEHPTGAGSPSCLHGTDSPSLQVSRAERSCWRSSAPSFSCGCSGAAVGLRAARPSATRSSTRSLQPCPTSWSQQCASASCNPPQQRKASAWGTQWQSGDKEEEQQPLLIRHSPPGHCHHRGWGQRPSLSPAAVHGCMVPLSSPFRFLPFPSPSRPWLLGPACKYVFTVTYGCTDSQGRFLV